MGAVLWGVISPLEGEAPRNDDDILGEAHGEQHLGSEHACRDVRKRPNQARGVLLGLSLTRVADLDDLVEAGVVGEDLHARFGVGVVGGLELEVLDAELLEECVQRAHEVGQREPEVCDHPLDLMELGQVRRVQRLVAEHTVDREVLYGLEWLL